MPDSPLRSTFNQKSIHALGQWDLELLENGVIAEKLNDAIKQVSHEFLFVEPLFPALKNIPGHNPVSAKTNNLFVQGKALDTDENKFDQKIIIDQFAADHLPGILKNVIQTSVAPFEKEWLITSDVDTHLSARIMIEPLPEGQINPETITTIAIHHDVGTDTTNVTMPMQAHIDSGVIGGFFDQTMPIEYSNFFHSEVDMDHSKHSPKGSADNVAQVLLQKINSDRGDQEQQNQSDHNQIMNTENALWKTKVDIRGHLKLEGHIEATATIIHYLPAEDVDAARAQLENNGIILDAHINFSGGLYNPGSDIVQSQEPERKEELKAYFNMSAKNFEINSNNLLYAMEKISAVAPESPALSEEKVANVRNDYWQDVPIHESIKLTSEETRAIQGLSPAEKRNIQNNDSSYISMNIPLQHMSEGHNISRHQIQQIFKHLDDPDMASQATALIKQKYTKELSILAEERPEIRQDVERERLESLNQKTKISDVTSEFKNPESPWQYERIQDHLEKMDNHGYLAKFHRKDLFERLNDPNTSQEVLDAVEKKYGNKIDILEVKYGEYAAPFAHRSTEFEQARGHDIQSSQGYVILSTYLERVSTGENILPSEKKEVMNILRNQNTDPQILELTKDRYPHEFTKLAHDTFTSENSEDISSSMIIPGIKPSMPSF